LKGDLKMAAKLLEVLAAATKLGFTSFGGPVAHLGYFHDEYVKRRQWLDERSYAELVALCQFLPGPASSQVGIGIGVMRAGLLGGLLSWIGFTLPSVLALVLFAFFLQGMEETLGGWIHGLKVVAVAIVAQAVLSMGQKFAAGAARATLALFAAILTLLLPMAYIQIAIILLSGLAGLVLFKDAQASDAPAALVQVRKGVAITCLVLFFALLFLLPVLAGATSSQTVQVFDSFYRSGSLVFGGGHVVLPLLEREVVQNEWLTQEEFLAGYGAAQAVPGPLFTFASYLGAVMNGWKGALVATIAIFLPAFLLVIGTLPFWDSLRRRKGVQGALCGINASVVGILLAALYDPIFTSTIHSAQDFCLAALLFVQLAFWKLPPWIVVVFGASLGSLAQTFF
jgi:chromate transporter